MRIKQPVILFDGVCNLCNGTVNFLIKHDREKQFRFASLQSETGKLLIQKFHISIDSDSVILIKSNRAYSESDAAVEIARMLPYPWKMAVVIKIIPKKMRDGFYRLIARNRYRWFGKSETCRIPKSGETELFIT